MVHRLLRWHPWNQGRDRGRILVNLDPRCRNAFHGDPGASGVARRGAAHHGLVADSIDPGQALVGRSNHGVVVCLHSVHFCRLFALVLHDQKETCG